MVGLQTLDLAIGVRVPASQPISSNKLRATRKSSYPFCVPLFQFRPSNNERFTDCRISVAHTDLISQMLYLSPAQSLLSRITR